MGKVEKEVKRIGRQIDKAIIQPVIKTVEAVVSDPRKLAAVAISVAFPGAGAAIGSALGLGTTAAAQVVGQALLNTALNGGDVKAAVISAALPVVGKAGTDALTKTLAESNITGAVNQVITRAVTQGTTAAILGKDPLSAALLGGVTAGVNAIVPDIPGYKDLPLAAKNAVNSAIATKLTGGDVGGAVSQSLVNDAIAWAKAEVNKIPNALKAAQATYKADTGESLSDERAAELLGVYGADGLAAAADRLYTSKSEAADIWRKTVGTEPTEFDLMEIIGLDEGQAGNIASRAYDVRQSVFIGDDYGTQAKAQDAAEAAGYSAYTWKGEEHKTPASADIKEVENKKYELVDQLLKSQGTTIARASDDQLRAAMDTINAVPTGLLGNATLQDVLSGKYSATNADGTLRIEVTGAGALANSPNASKAAAQLPTGFALATESEVWGADGKRNPNVEYMVLPDGTAAFVKNSDGSEITQLPEQIITSKRLDELSATDPEAWLQMASQFDKSADGTISDYLVNTANSLMLGAYATGNEKFGDTVKQTLSLTTQGVGEQVSNLATFFTDRLGMDHNSAVAAAGKALQEWGAANQSKSTKDQEAAIIASVGKAKSVGDKIGAFVAAAKDNPGGLVTMIAKEGVQEILPLWAAKTAYRLGSLAAIGANTAVEAMESWGAGTKETYDQAKKMGFSDEEARTMASKVGLQSAVITTFTNGVGDTPLVKRIIGDAVKDSALGITKAGGREAFTEYFDGLGSNAVQQYQLTGQVNWDQATTAATIGAGVGAGTSSGIMLGAAINSSAVVGRGADGSNVTYADFLSGNKQVDMSTVNLNTQVGVDADGDAITLGNIVAMPVAAGLSYDVVKSGLPASIANTDVVLGTDELGNTVTLSSLMSGVTEGQGFDAVYKSLLDITLEQRTEAKYDFVSDLFGDMGYKPTPQEINDLIAQNPAVSQIDKAEVEKYIAPLMVTEQEAKDAYAALGLNRPTQADILKLVGQYDQAGLTDKATENLDAARYNSLLQQIEQIGTQAGVDPAALDAIRNDLNAQITALGGDVTKLQSGLDSVVSGQAQTADQISNLQKDLSKEIKDSIAGIQIPASLTEADVTNAIASYMEANPSATAADVANAISEYMTANPGLTQADLDSAVSDAIKELATADQLADLQNNLVDEIQAALDIGIQGDAAIQAGLDSLAEKVGTNQADLLAQLGTTEAGLKAQFATDIAAYQEAVSKEIADTRTALETAIADAKATGLEGDAALKAAIDAVAATQQTSAADLLTKLGTTEAGLKTEFAAGLAGVSAEVADTRKALEDAIQAAKDIGLEGDVALQAGIDSVAANLGTTKEALLTQLGTTEETLRTEFASGITGLETQMKAQYDALTTEQKALADALTAQGTTLADAIAAAKSETAGQISELEAATKAQYETLTAAQKAAADALVAQGQTLQDAITAAKTETAGQIANVETRLTDAIAAAEAMGLSRDQAITAAVDSVAAELGTTRADLLTQLGTTEAALRTEFATGISGLEAQTKAQYDSLSAAQKATADALVAQGTTLADAIASAQQQTAGQIADVETRLTDAIAAAEAMGLSRDQAITAAVESVAADLGTTKADLLTQLGTTEQALRTEFTTGLAGVSAEVKAAYDSLTADQKALADQLAQQGVDFTTAIQTAQAQTAGQIGELTADVQAKYDALTAEQKALANQLTQQGVDLNTAIATAQQQTQQQITNLGVEVDARINQLMQQGQTYQQATQQAFAEVNAKNQEMAGLIGTQGRAASQQDIDALNQMLGGQRSMDLAYDVTGDKQITQADIDFLTQVVGGVKTDWTAPQESPWAATGLYGQIQANELRRQQDLAAAEAQRVADQQAAAEQARQESVRGGLRTTALQGQQQLQALQQQLPQAMQIAQTTSTPIYGEMGPYLDLGSPLDFDFFKPSAEKQAGTKQAQPTKIAAGGYIDDLLAGDMTADDLLNLLR